MQGADEPSRMPKTLFTFNSPEDLQKFATGCDADIGGKSTVHLDLQPPVSAEEKSKAGEIAQPTARFWGEMSLDVRSGLEERIRGGYAGFRSKARTLPSFLLTSHSN